MQMRFAPQNVDSLRPDKRPPDVPDRRRFCAALMKENARQGNRNAKMMSRKNCLVNQHGGKRKTAPPIVT
jgi:hypothetical protein